MQHAHDGRNGVGPATSRRFLATLGITTLLLTARAILFDLDGVLVDSAECIATIWREWAARHGLDGEEVVRVAQGRRSLETIRIVAPEMDPEPEVAWLAERETRDTHGVYEVPGARQLVAALPDGAWAVVTSGLRAVAELRLRHTGLPIPRVFITAEMIARSKPDPEGYDTAAARLGVASGDCIVIEDSPSGVEAGLAAGMRVIAVASTQPAEALTTATVVVPTLASLRVSARDGVLTIEANGG